MKGKGKEMEKKGGMNMPSLLEVSFWFGERVGGTEVGGSKAGELMRWLWLAWMGWYRRDIWRRFWRGWCSISDLVPDQRTREEGARRIASHNAFVCRCIIVQCMQRNKLFTIYILTVPQVLLPALLAPSFVPSNFELPSVLDPACTSSFPDSPSNSREPISLPFLSSAPSPIKQQFNLDPPLLALLPTPIPNVSSHDPNRRARVCMVLLRLLAQLGPPHRRRRPFRVHGLWSYVVHGKEEGVVCESWQG